MGLHVLFCICLFVYTCYKTSMSSSSNNYKYLNEFLDLGFLDRTLLFSVSNLPVLEFTELSIAIGIDCWHWLIASRPDLEYRVKGYHF